MTPDDRPTPGQNRVVLVVAFLVMMGVTLVAFGLKRSPVAPGATAGPQVDGVSPGAVSEEFQQQVAALEARLEAAADDTVALAELSDLMRMAHQPERSLELATRWMEVAPLSNAALDRHIAALAELNRWDEAYEANQRLFELDPANLVVLLNMGAIEANRGDEGEARRWWTRILTEAPGSDVAARAETALASLEGSGG